MHERTNLFKAETGDSGFGQLYSYPKVNLRITVNLYKKEESRTLVKIKVNTLHQNCIICSMILGYMTENCQRPPKHMEAQSCPLPSAIVPHWYQQLWDEIEKSIFMQRETILGK